jgi:uncharacterized membrane protein
MLENMTTGEKALIGATAIGIAALVFHKPTRNAVGLSDGKRKKNYELPNTNVIFTGLGVNSNGIKVAKFRFINGQSFTIETNDNIRPLHRAKMSEVSENDLPEIKKEVVRYIKTFGNKNLQSKLRTY